MTGHQGVRHDHAQIMLRNEGFKHSQGHLLLWIALDAFALFAQRPVDLSGVVHVGGEIGTVAQMAATPHHGQVHTGATALHLDRQHVNVFVRHVVHGLLVQHPRQGRHLVADLGSLLELEPLRVGHHAGLERVEHGLGLAPQKRLRIANIAAVSLAVNQIHTRAAAAFDLVEQAWARAVGEHGVFAGAKPEHLLQQGHRFFHRPGAGIGPVVAVALVDRPAVVRHAGKGDGRVWPGPGRAVGFPGAGDLEVGVALVVPEQDVELGVQRLDQVVFQQQGLSLGPHHGGFHAHDAADHVANARAIQCFLEVAADPLLEVARLADVEQLALGIEITINPGQARQGRDLAQQLFGMRRRHGSVL